MIRYLTSKGQKRRWWEIPTAVVSGLLGYIAVKSSLDIFNPRDPVPTLLACVLVTGAMLSPLYLVVRTWLRRSDARKLSRYFDKCRDAVVPLSELEKRSGVKKAEEKLRTLVSKGYLQNIAIDLDRNRARLADASIPAPEEAPELPVTENDEFNERLREIRRLNDEIDNKIVSGKIYRIEELTAGIFGVICEKPDRSGDARRFMNYYLPTTLKLLESYRMMEKQKYQGDNIRVSRMKIEQVLDMMIQAMERQQDKLFQSDVLDVETDITVLETMMAADGLTDDGLRVQTANGSRH